jgi:hypothetical protein
MTKNLRMAREKKTVEAMINIFCHGMHKTGEGLCDECRELLDYAGNRLAVSFSKHRLFKFFYSNAIDKPRHPLPWSRVLGIIVNALLYQCKHLLFGEFFCNHISYARPASGIAPYDHRPSVRRCKGAEVPEITLCTIQFTA